MYSAHWILLLGIRASLNGSEYVFAVRHFHCQPPNLNLSLFSFNKECYSMNCQCESFPGAGSHQQQGTQPNKVGDLLRGQKIERHIEGSPLCCWCVSLIKSVEPPLIQQDGSVKDSCNGTLTEWSGMRVSVFLGCWHSNTKGRGNLPFSHEPELWASPHKHVSLSQK